MENNQDDQWINLRIRKSDLKLLLSEILNESPLNLSEEPIFDIPKQESELSIFLNSKLMSHCVTSKWVKPLITFIAHERPAQKGFYWFKEGSELTIADLIYWNQFLYKRVIIDSVCGIGKRSQEKLINFLSEHGVNWNNPIRLYIDFKLVGYKEVKQDAN